MFLVVYVLDNVCTAADYFRLAQGKIAVYVFNTKDAYEFLIVDNNVETEFSATAYRVPFQTPDAGCFIFRGGEKEGNNWFVWSVTHPKPMPLGARLNNILFLSSGEDNDVRILSKDGSFQTLNGEYIVYDSMFIPKGSQMCYADRGQDPQLPNKIMLIRKEGEYKSYGFYLSDGSPCCRNILISSIIFREGAERVLLWYDEEKEKYIEFFRCVDISRNLNEYFIELTKDYHIGGKIHRYNGKTENMEKIYEGNFRLIDFENGVVRGDDGKDYGSGNWFINL